MVDICNGDATYTDLNSLRCVNGIEEHVETTRKGSKFVRDYIENGWSLSRVDVDSNEKITKKDDVYTSTKRISVENRNQLNDYEYLLKIHGFEDVDSWEVKSAQASSWGAEGSKLYSSKIVVAPKKNEWSIEKVDEYFSSFKCPTSEIKDVKYAVDGEYLEICIADLHVGLFSEKDMCGEDYNIKIAVDNYIKCIEDVIRQISHIQVKKIYLVSLGDMIQVDNFKKTTTAGTFVDGDRNVTAMFDAAVDVLIRSIYMLLEVAPVELIYVSGNHDRLVGYTAAKCVDAYFSNNKNVTCDLSTKPNKYRSHGNFLVGWTHGEMPIANISSWLVNDARKEFGMTKYAEVHAAHKHSQWMEHGNVIVRRLSAMSGKSDYETSQGYGSAVQAMTSFLWNEQAGLKQIIFSNIQ